MFHCEKCNYSTNLKYNWKRHLESKKHLEDITIKCTVCNYLAKTRSLYNQHLQTKKHKKNELLYKDNNIECNNNILFHISDNDIVCSNTNKNPIISQEQQQEQHTNQELQQHQHQQENINTLNNNNTNDLIKTIVKDFIELQKDTTSKLFELAKQPTITNNTQKNVFKLNNFLQVNCKDAINYSDFLKSIEVNRNDLEYLQQNGYVKSYENVVLKQLQNMEQTERPLHCLDQKRKKFIVKDKDVWTKENSCDKIRLSIDFFCNALIGEYNKWKDDHPNWKDNTEDEIFDVSLFMSNEIFSPYNEKKKDGLESKIQSFLTGLVIDKIQNKNIISIE
jgi:hypothetical protein